MSTTLANAIISCRTLVGDGPTDNLVRQENMNNPDVGNVINSSNTIFSLMNYPVVPNGLQLLVVDGTILSSGFTINEPTGEIALAAAPTATVYASYYYYLMPDTTWIEFIRSALELMNISTGVLAADVPNVPEGALLAFKSFACWAFCMRVSTQTGLWYNQKLQERAEDREPISRKFLQTAQEWKKQGDALLAAYYSGSGTQLRPSMKIVTFSPRPITPSR